MFDLIIRNGKLYDGTENPWTRLDIGIVSGKIANIGDLGHEQARIEIDAQGLAVAPGFIDTHVHSDLLCTKPEIHKIKVLQGVTTELLGQDGISVAPVSELTKPLWQKQLKGLNGDIGEWPWHSIDEYLKFLDKSNLAGNVVYLVPHGNIRTLVMGFAGRKATRNEMQQMRELVEEGMRQGAVGVSSGLIYPPNVFADKEELIEICKGAAKYDGCFVVHIRNESHRSLEALDEVIDVARQSGVRLHVSHFKVAGQINRDKYEKALAKMDAGRAEGIEITFDQYPYTAGSTVFHAILPPWMHSGGTSEMLERLKDPVIRQKVKEDFQSNLDYENWVLNCGWENIIIASVSTEKNKRLEGKNVLQLAEIKGVEPADAAFDLLLEENAGVTMVVHWGNEQDVIYGMKHPLQIVSSDGIFGGKPHPRLYGTYPRVLGRFVREKKALTLEQAIRKMSGAPAQLLRLKDRGFLREGYWADIVVFDPDTVLDRSTYEDPLQEPAGIHYVLVNGELTVKDGEYLGTTAGQVIRRKT
ncbi:D-aminoacylase domain protein [Caldalkalibacillus thermarum TA2.A1]|uniref:D-aminoacylase domain protein n=1 Tax=Caldalkalibacillus thermarum (strain TA2.A1) TaxID=986075 RepID=F5L492_CALTT|nr:D-aminoacylase [Caldalkalibacillus thermarum]EGL83833.1 D-aminoacylase domain protein [Caldalkalibacillus thermarum TA2.A1]